MKFKLLFFVSLLSIVKAKIMSPPDPYNAAAMARYVVHNTAWASVGTISTLENVRGYPFITLKSISDGPESNGTGVPYLYMTDLDLSGKDIKENNNVTIMCTLEETDYCQSQSLDPQDPRCAKVMVTGKLLQVAKTSPEFTFGQNALFEKHPSMKYWPTSHGFYVAKVEIEQVCVLDHFGGAAFVPVDKYFNPDDKLKKNILKLLEDITVLNMN